MKLTQFLKKIKLDQTSRDVIIGVAIALLVATNLLITNIPLRLDLSRGKAYSLSPSTIKIIRELKSPVEITFFQSNNIPTSFITTKNQVNDLLIEYKRGSSKISVKTVDPKTDAQVEKLAMQDYGIQQTEFSQIDNDQFAVSSGYFSLGVKINDKLSSIQRIDPANLEYNITSIIYKLSQTSDLAVGIVGDNASMAIAQAQSPSESMMVLRQILGQQFTVNNTDLANEPTNEKTLIILDSQSEPVSDKAVENLISYLNKGGKAIILTDGMRIDPSMIAASNESKLKPIFDQYGIKVNNDFVLSSQAETVTLDNNVFNRTLYPFWLRTNVFNPDASYTSNVNYLTFPWVSSIALIKRTDITQKEIVRATKQSWLRSGEVNINPQSIISPSASELKQPLLIAYAKNQKNMGEIMVISSSRFVQDNFLSRSGNLDFTINLINEFASDGALSGIRSRALTALPLPSLSSSEKEVFKWANVFALPLLLGIWGLLIIKKRESKDNQ